MKKGNIFAFLMFFLFTSSFFFLESAYACPCHSGQSLFIPNISLIADTSVVFRDIKDREYEVLGIPGFIHSLSEGDHQNEAHQHGHHLLNFRRGFNLNYGELAIGSAVDPYVNLDGIFHLGEGSFDIEELYFTTRSLPFNFQIKGGKFLSSIGRINPQHQHEWDFADLPLVYQAFFGQLNEKGVQITWLAPTPFYLLFGGEVLQGENERSFGRGVIQQGQNIIFDEVPAPSLFTAFVKTSYDIGNLTFLLGGSFLTGRARIKEEHENQIQAFGGRTNIFGADLYAKYFIDSYRYISLQGEYFFRNMKGENYENGNYSEVNKNQSGFYIQTVFKFTQRWRAGARFDMLIDGNGGSNHMHGGGDEHMNNGNENKGLMRGSFMIDFTPSELARIRLQYSYDRSKFLGDSRKKMNEIIFEFNFAIGAHGAHEF